MPDCAPAPAAPSCALSTTIVAPQRSETRKQTPAPRVRNEFFHARHEARPAKSPASGVSLAGTPAASVPLFKAHCSLLI